MIEQLQDEELAKTDLADQERLETERSAWESTYREIDELYPDGAGGFNQGTPGAPRHERIFDPTHLIANGRFAAAGVAITTPEETQYIRPRFLDPELMKLRSVQLWCQQAGERIYGFRHALHTGFMTAAIEDWDQLGRYGTSPMWCDLHPNGRGLFYRALHLSSCWIDTDFSGLVNRVHRKMCKRVSELAEMFGEEALTPKMLDALRDKKPNAEFEVLQVVAPNTSWDADRADFRRFPIGSRFLAIDEKIYLRRRGYHSMPVAVSRHMTSPNEKYGRSPAIKMMSAAKGLQAMRKTNLRAAHKGVDPALIFFDDNGATTLATKPGGLNAGFVSEDGRPLVARMPGGENGLPYAQSEAEFDRNMIRTEFLEEFFKILTDPNSRMTTTEVLEVMAKQGVLVRPFASRYASEKQHPISQRELDLALREGQLDPLPPEAVEAGAWPLIEYENPLAAMARADSTSKSMRFVEYATAIAALEQTPVGAVVNTEEMLRGGALEIGVKPSYLRDPKETQARQAKSAENEQAGIDAQVLERVAGSALDLTKANQISEGM